ncbi:MAG: tetratricopeptide repeat protein [Pirellulales bacterium]
MQQYRVNLGLLIGLIVGTLVLLVLAFGLHHFQLDRNADILIQTAEAAKKEGDLKGARDEYANYLSIRPDDDDVRLKLANVHIDINDQPTADPEDFPIAIAYLEDIVRQMPEEKELQTRLVEMYGQRNLTQPALDHLARMVEKYPDDSDLRVKQFNYLLASRKFDGPDGALARGKRLIGYDDKTDKFDEKSAIAPHEASVYANVAAILRTSQVDKPELADRVMEQLVGVNPKLPDAYLHRGQYLVNIGEPSRGDQDVRKAYKLAPDDANVLLAMAGRAEMRERNADAKKFLETGIEKHPEDSRFYVSLARIEMQSKHNDESLKIIEEGMQKVPPKEAINLLMLKADLQLATKDTAGIAATKEELRKAGYGGWLTEFLDARLLLMQDKWYEASIALAELQAKLGNSNPFTDTIAFQLGLAYENSGQLDKAETAYKAILARSPSNDPAKAGVERVGRRLQRDVKSSDSSDLDQMLAAEAKKPKSEQNWAAIDSKVAEFAEKRKIEGAALELFWARVMLGRENFQEARKRLVAAREKDPDNVEVRRLAVLLLRAEDHEKGPAKALQLLDQTVEQFGDKPDLRLDRADCLIAMNLQNPDQDKLKLDLAALTEIPSDWSENDQVAFWNGIAPRYAMVGMRDETKDCLNRVAELRPKDLPTRLALFNLALEANDDEAMKLAQEQILNIVGTKEDSTWLYTEARRRLSDFARGEGDKDALREIQQLTDRAMKDRPNWFELQLLSAELAVRKGDEKDALAHFEKAQELGRPSENAILLHVQLLLRDGRREPAKRLMEKLPESTLQGNVGPVYADVLLSTGDVEKAVDVITKYAEAAPKDAGRQLTLGQVLTRASSDPKMSDARRKDLLAQAGKALQLAVKLSPESPQTWLALISYQVVQKDLEGAKATLQQAQLGLAEDQMIGVLAKGNEIMGQWFDAENVYLTTLEAQPDNLLLAQELATFYLGPSYPRNDKYQKATPLVNRILKAGAEHKLESSDPNLMWARRAAAQMLAETGDYQKLRKAEKLLASNAIDGTLPTQERLQMANILATRADPISRDKAKRLFEAVKKDQPLSLRDDMVLGNLYFARQEWEQCKRHMRTAVAQNRKSPDARALFANMILQRGSDKEIQDEAWRQISELKKIAPNDARTVQLIVAFSGKTGKEQQARDYLLSLLPKVKDPAQLSDQQLAMMEFVAPMLVSVNDLDNAEKLYRAIVAKNPNKVLALADFLGTHRDVGQAFELLDSVYKPELTEPVSRTAIGIVRSRRDEIQDKYDDKVRGWLERGLLENPDSVPLQMLLAEFADTQKNYDEAAEIYKKLLARDDVKDITRAIVLNNLAFLVALADNADEAGVDPLKLIDEAIQILGPTADILDSRAVVYLAKGDYQKAIRDLDNSLTDNPTPAKYFHKAVAHLGAGENTAALKAWDDAHKLNKDTRSTLNRMEFEQYDRAKSQIEKIRSQSQSLTRAAG